jgi:HK97 family phage major capsid protein
MEIDSIVQELGAAFAEFKQANDARLREIEKKGSADVVLTDKVERLSKALGDLDGLKAQIEKLETRAARPAIGANGVEVREEVAAHRKAFGFFIRKGVETGLADLERKALSIGGGADGGFAVPEAIDTSIQALLVNLSPMRALANVVTVGTSDYKKLVNVRGTASGWVGETAARPATNTPQLAEVAAVMGELYANPQATQTMLDDALFDAEAWIAGEVATEFARAEGAAFVVGTGTNMPKGLLAYTTAATADGTRAFGTIEHVASGAAGDWAASDPADKIIALVHKLKAGHRVGAVFLTNKALLAEVRTFKDSTGQYLWQPSMQAGTPSTLLGFPVIEDENVPTKAANSLSLAFGNMRAAYTVVDRIGTRVLRDPYSNKPYVGFYTTKRVGGMITDSEAVKVLKFSA